MADNLTVRMMRHGDAKYEQLEVPFDEANDLTQKGEREVRRSFITMFEGMDQNAVVHAWVSPMGRTQHTLKIGKEILDKALNTTLEFQVVPELTEVKQFEWPLFFPLVVGGEVDYGGRIIQVNKEITNPDGLSYASFFNQDRLHYLPEKAIANLPRDYFNRLQTIERVEDLERRARGVLAEAERYDKADNLLLITHEGVIGPFISDYTRGIRSGIKTAGCLTMIKENGKLTPTQMIELT